MKVFVDFVLVLLCLLIGAIAIHEVKERTSRI